MEHRWGERVNAAIEVRLIAGSSYVGRGVLRDVSISGGYIETGLRLPLWLCLQVEIVPHPRSPRQRIAACLARQDERGIGVEWQELAPGAIVPILPSRVTPWPDTERWLARSA